MYLSNVISNSDYQSLNIKENRFHAYHKEQNKDTVGLMMTKIVVPCFLQLLLWTILLAKNLQSKGMSLFGRVKMTQKPLK